MVVCIIFVFFFSGEEGAIEVNGQKKVDNKNVFVLFLHMHNMFRYPPTIYEFFILPDEHMKYLRVTIYDL